MSRHNVALPTTKEIREAYARKFELSNIPQIIHLAWGFDRPTGGYFIQIWLTDYENQKNIYLEDGLIGGSKNRILDKFEKYGIVDYMSLEFPGHFTNLCLDLPF
jgi:hypothetical protein